MGSQCPRGEEVFGFSRLQWVPDCSVLKDSRCSSGRCSHFSLVFSFISAHSLSFCLCPARRQRDNKPLQCCNISLYHRTIQFFQVKSRAVLVLKLFKVEKKSQETQWKEKLKKREWPIIHPSRGISAAEKKNCSIKEIVCSCEEVDTQNQNGWPLLF